MALLMTMPAKEITPRRVHEPEIGAQHQKPDHHPDDAQRNRQQNDDGLSQGVELPHQEENDDQEGHRQLGADGGVGLARSFVLAADLPGVPQGPGSALFFQPGDEARIEFRRGPRRLEVRFDGHGLEPVPAPNDARLPGHLRRRHLLHGHGAAGGLGKIH